MMLHCTTAYLLQNSFGGTLKHILTITRSSTIQKPQSFKEAEVFLLHLFWHRWWYHISYIGLNQNLLTLTSRDLPTLAVASCDPETITSWRDSGGHVDAIDGQNHTSTTWYSKYCEWIDPFLLTSFNHLKQVRCILSIKLIMKFFKKPGAKMFFLASWIH